MEETILLSNHNESFSSNKKIIQIKPPEYFLEKQSASNQTIDHNLSPKEQLSHVEGKIEFAEQELERLKAEQNELLTKTHEEITKERNNWEQEKEQLIEVTKKEGYEEGVVLGKEEGKSQYKTLLHQANSIIESAQKDYFSTIDRNEETIIDLAIHTAEKILQQKISDEPEAILGLVKAAIQDIKDKSKIMIYLHPENYQYVLNQKNELLRILDNEANLSIYINEKLTENACVIEHPYGQIDASIDTQLGQIRQILHELVMEKDDKSN